MSKKLTVTDLIAAGINSLSDGEVWVIDHDEGPLWDTASLDFTWPIRVFCEANDCDWDVAQESGFRLNKLHKPQPDVVG